MSNSGSLIVYVKEVTGAPIRQMAVVTVTAMTQQYYKQLTTQGGSASFTDVVSGRYTVQAIAAGYEKEEQEVELIGMSTMSSIDIIVHPLRDSSTGAVSPGPPILAPKAQKQLGLALQALREKKTPEALPHLQKAFELAPTHPEVNYVYGVYYAQVGDWANAKRCWNKAVEFYPQHPAASLSLGEALYRDGDYLEAVKVLAAATKNDPSSWRAQMLFADASLRLKSYDDVEAHALRAIELGHAQAASARFVLAELYFEKGDKAAALLQLRAYLNDRPGDPAALKAMERLNAPTPAAEPVPPAPAEAPAAMVPPAKWMPANVDDYVPEVESGVACALPEILGYASARVAEFLKNVDRFTATESLKHDTINASGVTSLTENRKFNYLVSYRELQPHFYVVEEFRNGSLDLSEFPERIATVGLPSLVLVFEESQRENYDLTCEGLAQFHGGLAWQVRFAQRKDKPRQIRSYRLGSRSYPIAIKGRAWIASDSYQIVRMETDLLSAPPEIRLAAEHINLEYGPVYFNRQRAPLWVPQNAEIYLDWMGHRVHRKHAFSDFLLFGVDEKIRIHPPKEAPAETQEPPSDQNKRSSGGL